MDVVPVIEKPDDSGERLPFRENLKAIGIVASGYFKIIYKTKITKERLLKYI